jgi:hypothetical protein
VGGEESTAPLVVGDRDAERLVVCSACGRLRGPWRYAIDEFRDLWFVQSCGCDRTEEPLWPRFDYNTAVELCWCCASEALPSGSRWSTFLCDECRHRALDLRRPDGRLVVPIGRHSLMNRTSLSVDSVWSRPQEVPEFAERLIELSAGITAVWEWGARQARAHLEALGLDGEPDVSLGEYLVRLAALPVEKEAVFAAMCRALGRHGRRDGRPVG